MVNYIIGKLLKIKMYSVQLLIAVTTFLWTVAVIYTQNALFPTLLFPYPEVGLLSLSQVYQFSELEKISS